MANITIRNLDDDVRTKLRIRAAERNRSMEEEVRIILRDAVADVPTAPQSLLELTRECFAANVAFYTTLGLIVIFFWQFLFGQFPDSETGLAVNSHVIHYPMMDTVFALVAVHAAHYLWRNAAATKD